MGEGRRHRRRGDFQSCRAPRRRAHGGEGRAVGFGRHPLCREHLVMLDHLRQVIGLRGYGQRDPLNEYKAEAFSLFEAMSQNLREAVTAQLMRVEIMPSPPEQQQLTVPAMEAHKIDPTTGEDEMALAMAGAEAL